jgi:hypothetical protein
MWVQFTVRPRQRNAERPSYCGIKRSLNILCVLAFLRSACENRTVVLLCIRNNTTATERTSMTTHAAQFHKELCSNFNAGYSQTQMNTRRHTHDMKRKIVLRRSYEMTARPNISGVFVNVPTVSCFLGLSQYLTAHVPTTDTVSLCALLHNSSRSTQLHTVPRHTQTTFFFHLNCPKRLFHYSPSNALLICSSSGGDTLSSRHVSSCDVRRAVGM